MVLLRTIFLLMCICTGAIRLVSSYNILAIPQQVNSHALSIAAIAKGLAARGHSVSILLGEHFRLNDPELNGMRHVTLERFADTTAEGDVIDFEQLVHNLTAEFVQKGAQRVETDERLQKISHLCCRALTTANEALLARLEGEKFDLAIVDGLFIMKCLYLIPHRLRLPVVTYADTPDPNLIRVPWLPSFVPHSLLPFDECMSFSERIQNLFMNLIFPTIFPDPPADIIRLYQRYGTFSRMDDLISKSQLWMIPKDPAVDYHRPMMPNMIYVGGLLTGKTVLELPANLKKFIEGSELGTVIVTFGTFHSSFPSALRQKFMNAFQRLRGYRIICRMDLDVDEELPDNVMIAPWLPQNDILAHPKIKLFITHCGNNGLFEAMYHGVPTIGFPMFGDQDHNARRMEFKGFGISMNVLTFTSDQLLENLHKILSDASYSARVRKASEIFRSRLQGPAERAAFWIEHVCKFGGDHLRAAGNEHLSLTEYYMIDIIAFVFVVMLVILCALAKLSVVLLSCRRYVKNKTE